MGRPRHPSEVFPPKKHELRPIDLPQDYWILLILPRHAVKTSTERIYADFDARGGERHYEERRATLLAARVASSRYAVALGKIFGAAHFF